MRKAVLSTIAATLLLTGLAWADPTTFYLTSKDRRNLVQFESKAPLETIVGTTGQIEGKLAVDPDNSLSATGSFEVDLTTLKTGIDMRDEHMREKYLETAQYPKATFTLTKITKTAQKKLADLQPVEVTAEGLFSIHGVQKPVTVTGQVTYLKESEQTKVKLPGNLLHIDFTFPLLLTDFGIKVPQMVLLKLDNKQVVKVDAFATTTSPEEMSKRQ